MRKGLQGGLIGALVVFLFLLFQPLPCQASTQNETFGLSGTGALGFDPPGFEGMIVSGSLAGGYFTLYIDDTGWPVDDPMTPQNERWEYIVANFFEYIADPGSEHWDGTIPPVGQQAPAVVWHFFNNGDNLGGVVRSLKITITDSNHNGIMDPSELQIQAVAGNLQCHVEQSTGRFEGLCGMGPMNGSIYDSTPVDIFEIPFGSLILWNTCSVPNENPSWGFIKAIYSE